MEASITAPRAGTVARTAIGPVQQVEGGDLLLVRIASRRAGRVDCSKVALLHRLEQGHLAAIPATAPGPVRRRHGSGRWPRDADHRRAGRGAADRGAAVGDAADVGPGAGGAVQRAHRRSGPGRRRGARPVRRVGGARAGGALAGGRARAVRRVGPAGRRGAAAQRRRARPARGHGPGRVRRRGAGRARGPGLRRRAGRSAVRRPGRGGRGLARGRVRARLAGADAVVVVERGRGGAFPWPAPLVALRERRYGDTVLHTGVVEEAVRTTHATTGTRRHRRGSVAPHEARRLPRFLRPGHQRAPRHRRPRGRAVRRGRRGRAGEQEQAQPVHRRGADRHARGGHRARSPT